MCCFIRDSLINLLDIFTYIFNLTFSIYLQHINMSFNISTVKSKFDSPFVCNSKINASYLRINGTSEICVSNIGTRISRQVIRPETIFPH